MRILLAENKKTGIVIFVCLLVLCEAIAYVATTPRPSEPFFQVYVLGSNHLATGYYPNNDPDIGVGAPLTWYLGVTNNMGNVQLISIRIKLSNKTIEPPNDEQALASPAPSITDFYKFLQDNETWEIPFAWTVTNATMNHGTVRILSLKINNETYQISDWTAANGYNFRVIFELWTWDTNTNALQFGWENSAGHRVAWLQIWFNMTTPGPMLQP